MGAILSVTDIEGDPVGNIDMLANAPDVEQINNTIRSIYIPQGWSMFHINAPSGTIKGVNLETGVISTLPDQKISTILKATLHKKVSGVWVPVSTTNIDTNYHPEVQIVKNNAAEVWFVEFSFDGIGTIENFQGYQIRTTEELRIAYVGDNHVITGSSTFPALNNTLGGVIPLIAGWNMIGFPGVQNGEDPAYMDVATIIDDTANNNSQYNNIDLLKDYTGQAVFPEWNFFGFNTVSSNLGYQIKVVQACNLIVSSSLNYGVINFIQPPLLDTVVDNGNNNDNDDVDDQVVTDTTMNFVFNYETIKQLVITPGFIGIHGNTQTFSNVWGIVIEHVLVGNNFLNEPLNSIVKAAEEFGLGPALEIDIFDIFIKNRFDLLLSDLLFAIDKQVKEASGKHNNNPKGNRPKDTIDSADVLENAVAIINEKDKKNKDKNQIKDELFTDDEEFNFDTNNSPGFEMTQEAVESNELFFSKHNQIKLMNVFKNTVQEKPEIYNTVVQKIKSFVNKVHQLTFFNRFLFYNQANLTTLQTPFGQSQNIDFTKTITTKLFGDDALQAGQQGFNNNEDIYIAFNMTEGFSNINIYNPETGRKVGAFFMGGVRNVYKTITVNYTGGYSYNGKYTANSTQTANNILSVNHKQIE